MRKYLCDEYKTVALLGSFGKQYDLMIEVAKKLISNGFDVLVPKLNGIKNDNSGFLILNGDENISEELLEDDYLDNESEIYARLNQFRYDNRLDPTKTYKKGDTFCSISIDSSYKKYRLCIQA